MTIHMSIRNCWEEILAYIVISAIIAILIWGYNTKIKKKQFTIQKTILFFFFSLYILILYFILLKGNGDIKHQPNFIPIIDIINVYDMGMRRMLEQIFIGITLFVPLGFFVPSIFKKCQSFLAIFIIAIVLSSIIEFVQYFIGRVADIDDVIENTIGALIGYIFFCIIKKVKSRKKRL